MMAVSASVYMDSTDSVLSILPLHHTYECTAGFLTMIYNGATITFNEGLNTSAKSQRGTTDNPYSRTSYSGKHVQ